MEPRPPTVPVSTLARKPHTVSALERDFRLMQAAGEISPEVSWDEWKGSSDAAQFILRRPPNWTSDKWATPLEFVRQLEMEFGQFDLDPCCEEHTAKASTFYVEDGLTRPWFGNVFLNPPYSKPRPWLERAYVATHDEDATVVALLPVRTDTRWFHEAVLGRAELRFIQGRIHWIGWAGTPIPSPKDPSMLAIFWPSGLFWPSGQCDQPMRAPRSYAQAALPMGARDDD